MTLGLHREMLALSGGQGQIPFETQEQVGENKSGVCP